MKALFITCISTLSLFVGSIWFLHQLPAEWAVASRYDAAVVMAPPPAESKDPKIWVRPSPLYLGDILELHFSTPNAPYLGVIDPKGNFFYIVYPGESGMGKLHPMVESRYFTSLPMLKIDTRSFKADPYSYGATENQPVFTCTGIYTFIIGENLHVDDPGMLNKASIQYIHGSAEQVVKEPTRTNPANSAKQSQSDQDIAQPIAYSNTTQ